MQAYAVFFYCIYIVHGNKEIWFEKFLSNVGLSQMIFIS